MAIDTKLAAVTGFLQDYFGGDFTVQVSTVAVGVAPGKAVDHNFERVFLGIYLISGGPVWLLTDGTVSSTKGIEIATQGGSMTLNVREDAVLPGFEWFAVSSQANQTLLIVEVIRFAGA